MTALVVKISASALHMYVHTEVCEDQHEECALCELAVQNTDIDTELPSTAYEIEFFEHVFTEEVNLYQSAIHKITTRSYLFGRPPPASI